MIRARQVGSVIGMFAMVILVASGCRRQAPAQTPAPPPPPQAAVAATPPAPPPPPAPAAPPKPAPLTEEQIFAQTTLEQLNAQRPLADVFFDYDQSGGPRRWPGAAAEERRLAEALGQHADYGRRPRRLARQLGVQPRARVTPRHGGQGLSGQPRCAAEPDHRREQGKRAAVLHDRVGRLLAAEPARALHHYGQVKRRA